MSPKPHFTARPRRRGAMLPMIALLLPVMIVMLGFAVDLAYMQLTKLELKAVTDAAARAAAATLSRTDDPDLARLAAKNQALQNRVAGKGLSLATTDIHFGRSERGADGRFAFQLAATPYNSVRVTGDRTASSQDGSVGVFFGSLYGVTRFEPEYVAIASFLNSDITLVLDRSGSMSGQKILDLNNAVDVFLAELEKTLAVEKVALVSYSTESRIDLNLTEDYEAIDNQVNAFVADGYTAIGEALDNGIAAVLGAGSRPSAASTIILMTDGRHNTGLSPIEFADDAAAQGVTVYTITFGADADQQLMLDVARMSSGKHYHADTGAELAEVFRRLAATASQLTE